MTRYGLIAGNGRFPLLALESARQLGHEITVIAIQEEASREVETLAGRCHWISLGQLGKFPGVPFPGHDGVQHRPSGFPQNVFR